MLEQGGEIERAQARPAIFSICPDEDEWRQFVGTLAEVRQQTAASLVASLEPAQIITKIITTHL